MLTKSLSHLRHRAAAAGRLGGFSFPLRAPALKQHAKEGLSRRMLSSSSNAEKSIALTSDEDGFATITLDRPQVHNAFSDVVIGELAEALEDASRVEGLRGLFVKANGKSFSAGGDLGWMKRAANYTDEQNEADALALSGFLHRLSTFPAPTIAIVQGPAFGGGVGLISACDIAVGVESAKFMLSEVRLGLLPATISPYVIRRIGAAQCRRYFLTAEMFGAQRALEMGLLHEVSSDADGLAEWEASFRKSVMGNSPSGVTASKELIDAVEGREIDETLMRDTARRLAEQRNSPEGKEGVGAFLEKRKPSWVR